MAAAAAVTTPGAGTGSRFAAACGALGQYVKAAERARAAVPVQRPLPLMPGADIPDGQEQHKAGPAPAPAPLTIVYGGRVLVLGDVPADKAANLLRLALVATAAGGGVIAEPPRTCRWRGRRRCSGSWRSARSASPYRRPDGGDACPDDRLRLAL